MSCSICWRAAAEGVTLEVMGVLDVGAVEVGGDVAGVATWRRGDVAQGAIFARPVKVRRLADQEGQRLQKIVRRGCTSSVRYRRALMLLASAGGNRVPVIAQLVATDEDTVRDVVHRFNKIGLVCLDPRRAGGRPRLLNADDEAFVVATATTRPAKLGQPYTALCQLIPFTALPSG